MVVLLACAVGSADHTSQRLPVPALSALAPALLMNFWPARVMLVPVVSVAVTTPFSTTLEAAVVPWLMADTVLAVTLLSVMLPEPLLVRPAPLRRLMATAPVPALRAVPEPMVMAALPVSRSESRTPLARGSLAISVMLPLPVLMLALISTERPASRVSAPVADPPEVMAVFTVMSLSALRMTAVPALSWPVMALAEMVLLTTGKLAPGV